MEHSDWIYNRTEEDNAFSDQQKQRRYLWANEPEIARRWTKEHGSRIQKDNGGIMRLPFQGGGNYLQNTAAQNMFGKMYHTLNPFEKFQINQAIDTYGPNESGITASSAGGGGGGGGGILGDEDINLDEFMNERLEERIEKEKRKIEEQLGIGGMGLPSLPKEPVYKEADPGQPVWDFETNKYYDSITGREIPNPNIPKKMDMYNMPYTADPYSPIARQASLTGNKAFDITTGNNEYIKRRQEDEEDNVPLRFRDAEYLSDYFNPRQRALRQSNRYWNRGDARTGPQKWMGNIGGNIMGGIRNIGQGVSNFMGDRFQKRPAVGFTPAYYGTGAPRLNKQGQQLGYSAAQLNQLNARGGYYSEPARAARRMDQRRTNILNRAAAGKPVGNAAILGPNYSTDAGGNLQFSGGNARSVGQQTSGRSDSSWKSDPFARGGLASIWPR